MAAELPTPDLTAELDLVADTGRMALASAANDERRARNLRWLTDAPKPWELLMRELGRTLREL